VEGGREPWRPQGIHHGGRDRDDPCLPFLALVACFHRVGGSRVFLRASREGEKGKERSVIRWGLAVPAPWRGDAMPAAVRCGLASHSLDRFVAYTLPSVDSPRPHFLPPSVVVLTRKEADGCML
jgi:hypothetical protein